MCIYVLVCVHVCMCMYVLVHVCMHECICVCAPVCLYSTFGHCVVSFSYPQQKACDNHVKRKYRVGVLSWRLSFVTELAVMPVAMSAPLQGVCGQTVYLMAESEEEKERSCGFTILLDRSHTSDDLP